MDPCQTTLETTGICRGTLFPIVVQESNGSGVISVTYLMESNTSKHRKIAIDAPTKCVTRGAREYLKIAIVK